MEGMDVFVSEAEIAQVASKMKKKEENGDWVVVFYMEERVFGIVPLTALKPRSGAESERLQPGQTFQPYEKLRAVYGKSVLDVLYLYRGTNDEEMEQFAKELDKLRRQNKQQPKSNQEGKRVRKRKQFSEYETEDCAEQTVMTDKSNVNKSPAVTIKKKASQNKHSKKEEMQDTGARQVKDIGNMSMLAGFANLIDEPFDHDVPLSEVLEENRKLIELEPFGDKVMRLEEELYEERKKVQALEEKLAFKDNVPNVVIDHIMQLTDLIREYFPRQGKPVKQSMQPSLQEPTVSQAILPRMMVVGTETKHEKENMKEPAQKVKPRCVQAPAISEKVERAVPEEKNIPMESQGSERLVPNTAKVGEGQLCEKLEEDHGNFGNQKTNRNLKALIVDPVDKTRFARVLVDAYGLYQLERKAQQKDDGCIYLLNGVIKLVFSQQELALSTGLGLRAASGESSGGKPLDAIKVEAIKEYMRTTAKKNNWATLTEKTINRKFTYQITNARRDLKSRIC